MIAPVLRIDLSDQSRDFQRIALQPGFPVLDRFAANSHIVRQWLGRFAAEPAWDNQTVRWSWRDDEESAEPKSIRAVTPADLRGPLRAEWDALLAKWKQAAPRTPNDQVLLRVLQQRLDKIARDDQAVSGALFQVRVRGRWRLMWCWGYERRRNPEVSLRVCSQADCQLAFYEDTEARGRCPRCGGKQHSGRVTRVMALLGLLLLAIGGGFAFWKYGGALLPATVIDGEVVDAVSGAPIASASIRSSAEPPAEARSDAKGLFRINLGSAGARRFEVEAAGYQSLTWELPTAAPPSGRHRLTLRGAAEVSGLILEEGTDRPIPFAAIQVVGSEHRAVADDVGLFLLPGVPSGAVELEVAAEGYRPQRISRELAAGRTQDLLLNLSGAATARGVVLDAFSKQPVSDAVVRIAGTSGELRTDAQGQFRREGLPGSLARFEVSATGYFTRDFERPLLPTGETSLRLLLRPELMSLAGFVADSAGNRLAGANVRVVSSPQSTKTSADGRFEFQGLRRGSSRFEASAEGYLPRVVELVVPANDEQPVQIPLSGSAKLLVEVTDAVRKTPIPDAEIRLAQGRWKGTSNSQGQFEFAELPSSPLSLEVLGRGYRVALSEQSLTAGDNRVKIELRGATVLSGKVLSAFDQRPIDGAEVRWEGLPEPQKTDAEGRFRFEDVPAGTAKLNITAPGFLPAEKSPETRADKETELPVELRGAATLRGQVLSAESGQPIEQATITLKEWDRTLMSDARGEFVLADVPARMVQLSASAKGYSTEEGEQDLTATPVVPLVLRLKPPHSLKGVVVDALTDQPVAGAKVTLAGREAPVVTEAGGKFELVTPKAELYEFLVQAAGYPTQTIVERPHEADPIKLPLKRDAEEPPAATPEQKSPTETPDKPPSADDFPALPTRPRNPLEVEFFGSRTQAANIGFVVDCSGSMSGTRIERTKLELLKAILNLDAKQRFYLSFFNDQAIPMLSGETQPLPASPLNKVRVYKWMKTVPASGGTQPEPSIQQVAKLSPQVIFLLSDGVFSPLSEATYGELKPRDIRVNTIAFEDESGKQALQDIANRTKGTYRFVPPAPIPEFAELSLVTRLFDDLLEQWLDPKTAAADAKAAHEALSEFCDGEDFGPRSNASEADRKRARGDWRRWWVEHKLAPEAQRQDPARLLRNFQNPSFWWRWAAVEAAHQLGWTDATPFIARIRDSESGVHQAARRALMALARDEDYGPEPDADAATCRAAFDRWTDWSRREKHLASFATKSDDALAHEFESPDVKTRRAALQTVANRGRFSHPEALIQKLDDADQDVRRAARDGLAKVSGKDFCPVCSERSQFQEAGKKWTQLYKDKAEGQAEKNLILAEKLEKNQRNDAARQWYERIQRENPNTEAAVKAAIRLRALSK